MSIGSIKTKIGALECQKTVDNIIDYRLIPRFVIKTYGIAVELRKIKEFSMS